jgi:hypothetical protein
MSKFPMKRVSARSDSNRWLASDARVKSEAMNVGARRVEA